MRKKFVFLSLLMLIMLFIITGCKRKVTTTSVLVPDKDSTTYYYTGEDIVYNIKANELYTITNNKQKNAGTYEVTVSLNDKTNCVWAKTGDTLDLKYEFIINPKKIDKPNVTVTEYGYTGEEITFDIPKSNFYTISNNKGTDAGEYQAKVSLNDKKNLVWSDDTTSDLTFNFSIVSNGISDATIEGINENYNYTGSEIMPNPIVKLANKTLTYNVDYTLAYENNVNVGTAKLTITGINTYSGTKEINYNILKVDPTYTAPTAKANLVYTSQEQELINAGSCDEGTIEYKLENGEYSTSIPKATNAGTYTVYYRIIGDANHNDIENKTLNVTISKATPTITQPTSKSNLKYTGQPQQLINAGSTSGGTLVYSLDGTNWNESIPTTTNAGTYTVYYKVEGNDNYESVDADSISVTISKATPIITAPTAKTLTYNRESQVLINAGSTSGGTLLYRLENTDYSTSLPQGVGAGTYTVYYKVIGNANYENIVEATITATIAKATPQITAPEENSIPYNGENQILIREIHTPGETTIEYKLNDGTYSTYLPQAKDLGTYTVYYKLIGDSNYTDLDEQSVTITIIKGTPIVNITAAEDLEYNATEQALITSATTTGGTLKYSLNGAPYSTDVPVAINAGKYTVWYKVEADDNYNALEPQSIEVDISKAAPIVTAPTAKANLVYNKNSQILINNDATTTGGTLKYSLDNITYSTDLPSAINAGIYTVYYKVEGNNNYEDFDYSILNVEIDKATPTYIAPVPNDLTYSGENQTLISAGTTSGGTLKYSLDGTNYSTDLPVATYAGTYTVWYKVEGNDNYNKIAPQFITVEIKKATPTLVPPTAKQDLKETDQYQELIIPGSVTNGTLLYKLDDGEYSEDIPVAKAKGDYKVYYKVIGDENYKDIEESYLNVTIAETETKIDPVVTPPTAKEYLVYTGNNLELINPGSTTGGTLQYSLDGVNYSTAIPSAKNADTYTVYYRVQGNSRYNDVPKESFDVTIAKANTVYTAPTANSTTYTGNNIYLITGASTSHGTFNFKLNDGEYSTSVPFAKNAGTYTVYYKIIGDANHEDVAERSIEVEISKATPVVTAPTAKTGLIYNKNAQVLIYAATTSGGVLKYSLDNINYSTDLPSAINASENYKVYYKVEGNNNYYSVDANYITASIAKATPQTIAPSAKALTYNRNSQVLINAASTTGGTVLYSLDDIDYSTELPSATNADTYTVYYKVQGNDNYSDLEKATIAVTINQLNISNATVSLATDQYTYDGTAKEPEVTSVIVNSYTLPNTYYEITYSNNINVGSATVTITATDSNYQGTKQQTFTIIGKAITGAVITLENDEYSYTGYSIEPVVTKVMLDTVELLKDVDYKVSYVTAKNVGTYNVTINGTGNYRLTATKSFTIISKGVDFEDDDNIIIMTLGDSNFIYNGQSQIPTITIVDETLDTPYELVLGTDYTLSYFNSQGGNGNTTNAGTITVTATGIGNVYVGDISATYEITKKEVINPTIVIAQATYTGSYITPTITSVFDGETDITSLCTLASGSSKISAATHEIQITFNSNNNNLYGGPFPAQFTINPKDASELPINDINDIPYTQSVISNGATPSVTIKDGTATLINGTDYTLEYSNNHGEGIVINDDTKNTSVATITITYKGNYTGSATKTFNIVNREYTITYVNDETETTSKYHSIDTNVVLLSLTKTGYTGYWNSSVGQFQFDEETTPAELNGDITLTAVWTEINYTITYHLKDDKASNSENNPTSYTITSNTITLEPATYANSNATFGGWYDNDELNGEAITEITQGSHEDIHLYAKWNYVSFNITYELNGGTNNPSNPATAIPTDTITLLDPTRDYYDFKGWYTESTFNTQIEEITNLTDHKTIYAKWELHAYTITYSFNTNNYVTNTNPTEYKLGDEITLANASALKCSFDGWYIEATFDTIITELDTTSPYDITIYGKFIEANTTWAIYVDDVETQGVGSISSNYNSITVGQDLILTASDVNGYTWDGWYYIDNNSNEVLVPANILSNNGRTMTTPLTAETAIYKAKYNKFVLIIQSDDIDRGIVSSSVNSLTTGVKQITDDSEYYVTAGTTIPLTATTTSGYGYTFIGWYNVDNNALVSSSLSFNYIMPSNSMTLKARWIRVEITNEGAGTVTELSATYIAGNEVTITATPNNSNIIFLGWYNGSTKVSGNASYTFNLPSTDTTLTAKFKENNITVSNILLNYTINDQTINYTYTPFSSSNYSFVSNNEVLTYTMNQTNNEKVFAGWWNAASNSRTLISGSSIDWSCTITMTDTNQTIYATWVNKLETSINQSSNTITSTYGLVTDDVVLVVTDTDEDYVWDGWYKQTDTFITNSNTLTITYNDSYKKLIEHDSTFTGLATYKAKWNLSGIMVESANPTMGGVTKSKSNSTYTITATPYDGYRFVEWRIGNSIFSTNAEVNNIPDDGTTYTALFEERDDMPYLINYLLEDENGQYQKNTTYSYSNNNGITNKKVYIDEEIEINGYTFVGAEANGNAINKISIYREVTIDEQTFKLSPDKYYICELEDYKSRDDFDTNSEYYGSYPSFDSNEQYYELVDVYQLTILPVNDETPNHIDFKYDVETVSVTYHYNNGNTINKTVKYNGSIFPLEMEDGRTWYTNCNLTGTAITSVTEDTNVWACYNGNNNLTSKFEFKQAADSDGTYYSVEFLVATGDIVVPEYYDDIKIRKIIIDNIYGKSYSSLSLPGSIIYVEYDDIEWILIEKNNNSYTLLKKEPFGDEKKLYDESGVNHYNNSTIKQYIDTMPVILYNSDYASLLTKQQYSDHEQLIKSLTSSSYNWWLYDTTEGVDQYGPYSMAAYVNDTGKLDEEYTGEVPHYVRPTITITL